jgi:hypothetical protein
LKTCDAIKTARRLAITAADVFARARVGLYLLVGGCNAAAAAVLNEKGEKLKTICLSRFFISATPR